MFQLLMPHHFIPDVVIGKLEMLDVGALKAKGMRGAVVDYDGVIIHSMEPPCTQHVLKLAELRTAGIDVVILSNRRGEYSLSIQKSLPGYPVVNSQRMKPHREPYEKALLELRTRAEETVLIEDRLITGVAGGKKVGMYTIWVVNPDIDLPVKARALCAFERLILRVYIALGLVRR